MKEPVDYSKIAAARAILDKPEHWTRLVFARDAKGEATGVRERSAVCFCMAGAMRRVGAHQQTPEMKVLRDAVMARPGGYRTIPDFNDDPDTTHADVLAVFDAALAGRKRRTFLDSIKGIFQ